MLKFIYKTLLISVLSGSLLMLDFSYKGMMINSAQAESVKTDKINDSDLMGTLTMTAVGTLAARLYTYKPTTDIMLAAAGGAIFIAGEVLAFIKLKDVMKGMEQQIQRDAQGNVNREQQASLERLKQSYVEAKKTAQTKKTLQMAAAAAFAAAAVMAYTMAATETTALGKCTAEIPLAIAKAQAAIAACSAAGGSCAPLHTPCITAANTLTSGLMSYELTKQAIGPSATTKAALTTSQATLTTQIGAVSSACAASGGGATVATSCTAKLTLDEADSSAGTPGTAGVNLMKSPINQLIHLNSNQKLISLNAIKNNTEGFQKYFDMGMNLFFPKAEAALFSAMGIASSAAVAFLMYTYKGLGAQIDIFMMIPQNRAIVWGILAGLTFAATTATNNVISQIEANIAKIDAILNGFNALAKATPTANGNRITNPSTSASIKPGANLKMNATNYEDVDLSTLEGGALPCFTGAETKNCKSFEESVKNLPSYTSLDLPTQSQVAGILKTANGVNGASKISGTTMDGLSRLAASANALKATSDKAKSKLQDKLKLAKSKTNLDAISKNFEDKVNGIVKEGLAKNNSTASSMFSSMYGAGSAGGDTKNANAKIAENDASKKAAPIAANVVDIGAGASIDPANAGLDGIDTGSGAAATMTPEELAAYNAAAKKSNLEGFDVPTSEITNDTSASIFDLISNRYQQSGYPRLFKIKEQPVPVKK